MRTSVEKPKATQPAKSGKDLSLSRAQVGQGHDPNSFLTPQRTIGNQAVLRLLRSNTEQGNAVLAGTALPHLGHNFTRTPVKSPNAGALQAKLSVNQPGDEYEQEADHVAEQVMRMHELTVRANPTSPPGIQRLCPGCEEELQRQPLEEEEKGGQASLLAPMSTLQRQIPGEEEEKPLQTKAEQGEIPEVHPEAEAVIHALPGRGEPMPEPLRAFMEPRFNADFRAVRIHNDATAHDLNRTVNAKAFTVGSDVVFGARHYAPETDHGRRLLAHELTHVLQQGQGRVQQRVQRDTCPARDATEIADSRSPAGLLSQNVVFNAAQNELVVRDFGIDRADVPPGVIDSPDWQRAMSLIVGDPSVLIALGGYSDCAGTASENLSLRGRRVDQVRAALPPEAQRKVIPFSGAVGTATYLGPNNTAQERAMNRAVKIWIRPGAAGVAGQDPSTMLPRARNMDEFLFLLRCAEAKLASVGITAPITVLSAIRQLYYGNASWSVNRAALWDTVIAVRPYPSSNNLPGTLGTGLYNALRRTDTVDGVAVGHLFTGMDAMAHLANVTVGSRIQIVTSLVNQEVATWSGDVGSAAAEFLLDDVYGQLRFNRTLQGYFSQGYAQDDDLRSDVESYAFRLGLQPGTAAPATASQPLTLNQPLSTALLEFYRVTSSNLAAERRDSKRHFLEAYGGNFTGGQLANRSQVFTTLQGSVNIFALPFVLKEFGERLRNRGAPPGVPDLNAFLPIVAQRLPPLVDQATNLFIDWLLR